MAKLAVPSTLTFALSATGKPITEERIQDLRDWDLVVLRRPIRVEVAEVTTTSTSSSGATIASFRLFIPQYAAGLNFKFEAEVKVSANTGHWWIEDDTSGDVSNKPSFTNTSYPSSPHSSQDPAALLVGDWAETVRTINVVAYIETSGTLSLRNVDRLSAWFEDDAG